MTVSLVTPRHPSSWPRQHHPRLPFCFSSRISYMPYISPLVLLLLRSVLLLYGFPTTHYRPTLTNSTTRKTEVLRRHFTVFGRKHGQRKGAKGESSAASRKT